MMPSVAVLKRSNCALCRIVKQLKCFPLCSRSIPSPSAISNSPYFRRINAQDISLDDRRIQKHLDSIIRQFHATEQAMSVEQVDGSVMQDFASLKSIVALKLELEKRQLELDELCNFIREIEKEKDEDLVRSAIKEKEVHLKHIEDYKTKILNLLIPNESADGKDIILELSAGVGGQEAMLFTKDLFDMYDRYSAFKGWHTQLLKYDTTDIGGLKNAHLSVSGYNAYKIMKYEAGVHRVQRVPKTERAGRIHTSTVTVAVLPQPDEIDIAIHPNDLKTQFKNSSGAGGQNVNKVATCVRLTHLPTGMMVECQVERYQHANLEIALKSLKARLYQMELDKAVKEQQKTRKFMVGTASRSEKVRTYNFPQDRITDHRINHSVFDMELFLQGTEKLDDMLGELQHWSRIQKLKEIMDNYNC